MEDNKKDTDLNPADAFQPEVAETQENAAETVESINTPETTAAEVDADSVEEAKTTDEISDDAMPQAKTVAATASNSSGSGSGMKALITLLIIALLGSGLLFWKIKHPGSSAASQDTSMTKISKEDMEFLLKDASPMMLKRLEEPEVRKQQIDNLKQMLALASAARNEGLAKDDKIQSELEDIRTQLIAVNYDREINKDKGPMPPFGFIGEDRINEYWAGNPSREAEFKKFFDTKVALAKEDGQIENDREPSEDDIKQAREYFAKTRIYAEEAEQKMNEMSPDFKRKVDLAVKLQQAQYLSRLYAKKVLVDKTKVTDEDVQKYVAAHPELDTAAAKKQKAQEVLDRIKKGEDFATLAKEFTEDPGSKDKGGLYENVTEGGGFDKTFESTALSLQPGQVADNLVETPFGYHIIKLEKKGPETKGPDGAPKQTYDVRHILFSTMVKDPDNPTARDMPLKQYVQSKLEEEKEKSVLDEIVAKNPVEVAEDFQIPPVSEEQMQQMMQQQMQQQQQQMPQDMPQQNTPPTTAPKGQQPVPKTQPKTDVKKK
jgi:parvulin-like peptidyl-prolyl isomerase